MNIEFMLKALGEPMRLKIYLSLLERKHCVRSLSKKLEITEPAVSQHIKVMREAGLVYGEKYGYHTHYMPRQEAVDFLKDSFLEMSQKSQKLERNVRVCQCEFREDESR